MFFHFLSFYFIFSLFLSFSFLFYHVLSFSFIFFHFLLFSFIFFHFLCVLFFLYLFLGSCSSFFAFLFFSSFFSCFSFFHFFHFFHFFLSSLFSFSPSLQVEVLHFGQVSPRFLLLVLLFSSPIPLTICLGLGQRLTWNVILKHCRKRAATWTAFEGGSCLGDEAKVHRREQDVMRRNQRRPHRREVGTKGHGRHWTTCKGGIVPHPFRWSC